MKRSEAIDKGQDYKCENCGGEFIAVSAKDDQLAEMDSLFTTSANEELVVVCDDCFRAMGLHAAPPIDEARDAD